jgi:hypothetical protein
VVVLSGIHLGMSFLQADCFRTKKGESKAFQNFPRTVRFFGLANTVTDTDTVAHGSFFVPKIILTRNAISIISHINFSRYNSSTVFVINC